MACKKRKTVIKKGKATEATTAANVSTPVGGFRNTDNELVHITCPNCGSDYINIHDDGDSFYCSSCGNTWEVDSEVKESITEGFEKSTLSKINSVIEDNTDIDTKGIKGLNRIFNFIFDYLDEECDGCVASKRISKKDRKDAIVLQWKIQGLEDPEKDIDMYDLFMDNKSLSKGYKLNKLEKLINEYQDVVVNITPDKAEYERVKLGILTVNSYDIGKGKFDSSVKVNKKYEGPIVQFTLLVPKTGDINLNKAITHKGNTFHIVVNEDLVATYDSETNVWSTVLFTEFEIINTVFRKSEEADEIFNKINSEFKYPMDTDEFMDYFKMLSIQSRYVRDRA